MDKREIVTLFGKSQHSIMEWRHDRFRHRLLDAEKTALFESCKPKDIATPVYTEVQEQQEGVYLFSGNDGAIYWSMCMCVFSNSSGPCGLNMDVACRIRKPVSKVGAVYASYSSDQNLIAIRPSWRDPSAIVKESSNRIWITPLEQATSFPVTVRFSFDIYFSDIAHSVSQLAPASYRPPAT